MKRFKIVLSLFVVYSFLFMIPADFAATKSLSLDEAITLSRENSADIRKVLNQEFSTQNTIRKNIQNSYQLEQGIDTFYDYIELYYRVIDIDRESSKVHPYYKYIGKNQSELMNAIGTSHPTDPTKSTGLIKKITLATIAGKSDEAAAYSAELDFVQLYMYFGDNPALTKESKYENFKKNEAMLKNSVDLINTKYEQGLIAATKMTEAGVIKLYVGIKDLEQGLAIKKELLATYEEGLVNMETSYRQGLVSKIEFENQTKTVAIQQLDTQNLEFQYNNLLYQLKKICGLPMDTTLNLSTSFENDSYKLNKPSMYLKDAFSNNMDYANLNAELTYNEKNFEVMNKYLDDMDKNKDFTKPIYYQEKVDQQETIDDLKMQLNNQESLIEMNVHYAYNDLLLKKVKVEHNSDLLTYSSAQLNSGIQSFKLGQITQLQLDQLKLQYANAIMTTDQNIRAYNTAVENFKLLVNYGVSY